MVVALTAHVTDTDRSVRYAVAWALGEAGPLGSQRPTGDKQQAGTPARPKHIARPHYPDAASAAKVEGTVVLAILIGEEGEVAYAEVVWSTPALDDAALVCVREWQFEAPMRVAGIPRATVAQAPVTFGIYSI